MHWFVVDDVLRKSLLDPANAAKKPTSVVRPTARNGARYTGPVPQYFYTDEDGRSIAKKMRYADKSFSWMQPLRSGEVMTWKYGLEDVGPIPLYRLPEVRAAAEHGDWVYVAEGERDADTIAALGLVGTTPTHGADT